MYRFSIVALTLLIIFLTIFPRSVELINKNYLFGFDQGREYLAAKSIVVDHKLTLIGTEIGAGSAGISGIFHGPIYYYLLAIPFFLFNGDPYGGMIFTWAMSILAVFIAFVLGRRMFSFPIGFIPALLVAISPPLISQARFIWSPNPLSPFILLSYYFLYLLLDKKKLKFLFLSSFFSAFVYNFELAIALPMCLTLFVFILLQTKLKNLKVYLLMFSGFIIGFLPAILFEGRHNFIAIRGAIKYLTLPKDSAVHDNSLLTYVPPHINSFMHTLVDTFPAKGLIPGALILVFLLVGVIYFLRIEKNKALRNFMIYLILLPFISFFVFSFLGNSVYHFYLTHLNFAYILMLSYILYASLKAKKIFISGILTIFIIFLTLNGFIFSISNTKKDLNDHGGTAKVKGLREAIDYIYTDAGNKNFGLLEFAPPIYTYQYDYMLWWYGQRKYGFIPHKEKKGEFYLWIEQDPVKPWSYKGWLETVIVTGKIEKTTRLPNGYIIQKRVESN